MAYIRELVSGKWQAIVRRSGNKPISKSFNTKTEAGKWARHIESKIDRGVYLRLALKAQSQARTTVETLAEIKNPRAVAFVRQANIANGPQQVNNGSAPALGNTSIPANELSGGSNELLQDTGTSTPQSGLNPQMEAVGAVNRTRD